MPSSLESEHKLECSGAQVLVADCGSEVAVIITHPWGPLGGDMHNNVVTATALYFQELGVTTLRLNFSGSQLSRGVKEVDEVVEAANFLLDAAYLPPGVELVSPRRNPGLIDEFNFSQDYRNSSSPVLSVIKQLSINGHNKEENLDKSTSNRLSGKRKATGIILIGYSYGALIAASASASIPQCIGVVSIAPPISVKHWLLLFNDRYHTERAKEREDLPRLMIQGSKDNFTSENQFQMAVLNYPSNDTTGAVIQNANHYFAGRERDVMNVIGKWLLKTFPSLEGRLRNLRKIDLYAVSRLYNTSQDMGVSSESESGAGTVNERKDKLTGLNAYVHDILECGIVESPCRSGQEIR